MYCTDNLSEQWLQGIQRRNSVWADKVRKGFRGKVLTLFLENRRRT